MFSRIVFAFGIVFSLVLGFQSCKTTDIASPKTATITALNCAGVTFSASATSGASYTGIASVPYSGGNGVDYLAGAVVVSTGVTGLSATLLAGTLTSGTGLASFQITGTPSAAGNANFVIDLGGQSCSLQLIVAASKASIGILTCTAGPANGSNGTPYNGTVTMAYTGGNGGGYDVSSASSSGVEGLTAKLIAGKLANGDGNLIYTITGTPTSAGTATFNLSLGGKTCTVTVTITAGQVGVPVVAAKDTVVVAYAGNGVSVKNAFENDGVKVSINGAEVKVTSTNTTKEIVYLLSGTATKGSFKIYSDFRFNISLKGVNITNSAGPAINIQSTKLATIHVLGGTVSSLTDGAVYTTSTEDQKGTLFSEGQLSFMGTGTLSITGNSKHGIVADDFIYVSQANIIIKSALSDGIHANDYFVMDSGTININSLGDGLVAEEGYVIINGGAITINSVDDGIAAPYAGTDLAKTPYVLIKGGKITVNTTGDKGNAIKSKSYTSIGTAEAVVLAVSGRGSKGIKTGGDFTLNSGSVKITTTGAAYYVVADADIAAPAAINCDKNLTIKGGNLTINSSGLGGKGINIDGTATISGGTTNISVTGAKYTYSTALTSDPKGFKSDGAFVMNSGELIVSATDDGIKSNKSITVNDGFINVTKSYEGMESILINIAGGVTNLTASNDGINTSYGTVVGGTEANDNSLLNITGGILITTGSDAIDSNGNFTINGGTVIANGNEDVDINGNFLVNAGFLIGAEPSNGMTKPMGTASAQVGLFIKSATQVAVTSIIHIEDASGKDLLTFKPKSTSAYFHFSSPSLLKNTSYKIYFGGTYTGGDFVGGTSGWGLYTGGIYSNAGATLKSSPTTSGTGTVNTISF
jgi:hypothetical protein